MQSNNLFMRFACTYNSLPIAVSNIQPLVSVCVCVCVAVSTYSYVCQWFTSAACPLGSIVSLPAYQPASLQACQSCRAAVRTRESLSNITVMTVLLLLLLIYLVRTQCCCYCCHIRYYYTPGLLHVIWFRLCCSGGGHVCVCMRICMYIAYYSLFTLLLLLLLLLCNRNAKR